jgi:hypothetical protein
MEDIMNKILKINIGWENNKYSNKMFDIKNNNWFIIEEYDVEDEILDKLSKDSRVIVNKEWDVSIVARDNVDEIEREYGIECITITDRLDVDYGDWEQDYDIIGKQFDIGEHQAYQMVGEHITEVIEEMSEKINLMSIDEIKNITSSDVTNLEYAFFSKYIYEELLQKVKNIENNYKDKWMNK